MSLISKILDAFKIESTREMETVSNNSARHTEMSVSEAYAEIDRAGKLADIANKTTNREEFYNSINEIERILIELSKYEHKFDFSYSPSANLKDLRRGRNKQIELLEKRIKEREKTVTIKKIKNDARSDRGLEPVYHDRFNEEYREVDNYREIIFNGRNFDIPEVKLCAAILIDGSIKGSTIRSNDHYSLYFEGRYGLMNVSSLHRWLYEQGYLRVANLPEALSFYKVPELKMILESLGLKKTGNKSGLIDRVISALDDCEKERIINQCEHLFTAEKGYDFLEKNGDYAMWHRKSYGVTFSEFNEHRILFGKSRKFHDTIFNVLSQKATEYQMKGYFSQLEMIHFWLGESLYDEGRYDLAIRYYVYRLYFSANLAWHVALFDVDLVRFHGIKKEQEYIKSLHTTFNQGTFDRLIELKAYYDEHILDIIYDLQILPYCIFDKMDMAHAIRDLYEGAFDEDFYTNHICINYGKYIKKFL